jgi:Protein of unknown function (DUF1552)
MMITKKAIPRRTILRGAGTALALPLLDSMFPALAATSKPVIRFGTVYVPNGIMMANWTPGTEGASYQLSPILKALEPYRNHLLVLSGLNSTPPPERNSLEGVHSRASTRFLTDIQPKPTLGSDLQAGISMDQIAANEVGQQNQFPSLQVGLDSNDTAGGGDTGYSRAYCSTISWSSATTPLPMENDPRLLFERLFGETGSDPAKRRAQSEEDRSLLDSITDKITSLRRKLPPSDSVRLTEYLDGVREVEQRIQKAEKQNSREVPLIDHPDGIPDTFPEHAKLMFDLMALAYQADLTRIITFMLGREFNSRTYPELDIHDGHHSISHHQNDPVKLAQLVKINTLHVQLFTYYLEKLKSTQDGEGSLLDHLLLVYGGGMSDGNKHWPLDLPVLLFGSEAGTLKPGRHIRFKDGLPLANLHLSLLDRLGVHVDKLGDSNGRCEQIGQA